LEKRKYTFEDWLADVQFHQPSLRVDPPDFKPDFAEDVLGYERVLDPDYNHLSETLAGQNYLIHNLPESLNEYGFMDDAEFQKVVEHRKIAYRLALDILSKQVEPYLNSYLKKDNTINQMLIKKRLKEIESYFESVDSDELQKAVSGEILELAMDGPTYKQFVESQDISIVMRLLFNSNTSPGIQSALPGYKKHPSLQILLRVLLEERNHLITRSEQLNLSAETIRAKYLEYKNEKLSSTKATDKLISWITNDLKLTVDHVQNLCGITITEGALKQATHRQTQAKLNKK
jgi:hypothetical protein